MSEVVTDADFSALRQSYKQDKAALLKRDDVKPFSAAPQISMRTIIIVVVLIVLLLIIMNSCSDSSNSSSGYRSSGGSYGGYSSGGGHK